jgi:hypothetical protein
MKMGLQFSALAVAFVTLVFWLFGGPHLGMSQARETRMQVDPVTRMEYPVSYSNITLGVDFLALSWMVAGLLFVISLLVRRSH